MKKPTTAAEAVSEAIRTLGGRAEAEGIEILSPAERAVVLTMFAAGIIGNGGFKYFYEGAYFHKGKNRVPALAEAYDLIGFTEAALAARKSLEFFPAGVPDLGPAWTNRYMDGKTDEVVNAFFAPLDHAIWALNDDQVLETALAALLKQEGIR